MLAKKKKKTPKHLGVRVYGTYISYDILAVAVIGRLDEFQKGVPLRRHSPFFCLP